MSKKNLYEIYEESVRRATPEDGELVFVMAGSEVYWILRTFHVLFMN